MKYVLRVIDGNKLAGKSLPIAAGIENQVDALKSIVKSEYIHMYSRSAVEPPDAGVSSKMPVKAPAPGQKVWLPVIVPGLVTLTQDGLKNDVLQTDLQPRASVTVTVTVPGLKP